MIGVSLLCGMGITVPLLSAHAIFGSRPVLFSGTQVGLLLGTVGAAILGGVILLGSRQAPDAVAVAGAGDDPGEGRTT
jgi:Na+/H+ antiporter NhaA